MFVVLVVYLVLTWQLIWQRPVTMYIAGILLAVCILLEFLAYVMRNRLGRSWLRVHRVCTLIMLAMLCTHFYIGISSFSQYQAAIDDIWLSEVDLRSISDGEYTGEYDAGYIYAKVVVRVKDGRLENVRLQQHLNERGSSAEVIPQQLVEKQSTVVDEISGATNSSCVIMKAVENALTK